MTDKIKDLELEILNKRQTRDEKSADARNIKKEVTAEIMELSKDKNSGLTNQKLRDAALDERLQDEPEYQRLVAVVQTLDTDIALMSIDLSFEKRKFRVWYVEELKRVNRVME